MIDILYEDDRILVLAKPSGLLSVAGLGPDNRDCLARRVQERYPGSLVVHRLDRDTSGVIVMARDAEGHRRLGRQFEERSIEKRYIAVVAGSLADDAGEIDLPLRKDMEADGPRHIVDRDLGRAALTRYRALARRDDRTRVALCPRTGRSHQLRVHMAAIGHPILGDDIYAPPPVRAMATRLMLHAERLSLEHPGSGQRMTFEARCPF